MDGSPAAPEGYTEPEVVPRRLLSLAVWMLSLTGISLLVYTPGIRQSLIAGPLSTGLGFAITASTHPILYGGAIVAVVLLGLINSVIHEEVHKVTSRMAGYHSEVKLKPILHARNPYNYIPDEWVDKGEYHLILLAPLFVINLFAALLVIADVSPTVGTIGKAFLVVNTATSGDDIRMFIKGLTSDASTKYHHEIDNHTLNVYRSVESDE